METFVLYTYLKVELLVPATQANESAAATSASSGAAEAGAALGFPGSVGHPDLRQGRAGLAWDAS